MPRSTPKTLEDIKAMEKEFLVPTEVAPLIGCSPYSINLIAKRNPESLGFPVIMIGSYCKIPRRAFIKFMEGE